LAQIKGTLNWENKKFKDFMIWRRANPYATDLSAFTGPWVSDPDNQLTNFFDAARKEIAPKGEAPPANSEQAVIGKRYSTSAGPMYWNGKVFQKNPITPAPASPDNGGQ
jgi:hypothetical protein